MSLDPIYNSTTTHDMPVGKEIPKTSFNTHKFTVLSGENFPQFISLFKQAVTNNEKQEKFAALNELQSLSGRVKVLPCFTQQLHQNLDSLKAKILEVKTKEKENLKECSQLFTTYKTAIIVLGGLIHPNENWNYKGIEAKLSEIELAIR